MPRSWSYLVGLRYRELARSETAGRHGVGTRYFYSWDVEDRLIEAVMPEGTVRRYRYDAIGCRVAKIRLAEDGSAAEQTLFTWDGRPLQSSEPSRPAHSDAIVQMELGPGNPPGRDPARRKHRLAGSRHDLGRPIGTTGRADTHLPATVPGQYHDAETGLDYNIDRYYDVDTASHVSQDPLGLRAAPNHHGYVDNPLWWIDPLGLKGKHAKRT